MNKSLRREILAYVSLGGTMALLQRTASAQQSQQPGAPPKSFHYGPDNPSETYVKHAYDEQTVDLGEVTMNYVVAGSASSPALLLIPGQTESWWGYEKAIGLLKDRFHVHAVDLRGQGRSTRTPGRYTLDNMGNDLVRFIALVIRRPTVVSGLSSGGVLSAWMSAYAMPGTVRGCLYEDPPLFSSEVNTSYGQSIRQGAAGPMFALWAKYLGDQWSIGDWNGMQEAAARELHVRVPPPRTDEPPQNLKEYDPEWGRSFWTGMWAASCDHAQMLSHVKVPVLFTHHQRRIDDKTAFLLGATSDLQARRVREIVEAAGQPIEYKSFPTMGHPMHQIDPALFANTLTAWAQTLKA
ncbi:MAG TPA: alpha/beta hydrolase [Bryobacteraceae bacterium]|nr:alpha/beta hydrolase [Bryobacteraceae bacterium]